MEISKVNVIDSLLVNSDPVVNMTRGASSVSKNVLTASGGTNNLSNITYNVNINTEGTCLDIARMYNHVNATFAVTVKNNTPATGGASITVDSGNPVLIAGDNISFGCYPLNSMYGAGTNIIVNEQQICGYDVSTYGDLLLRLQDQEKINQEASFPSYPELGFAHYNDAYLTPSNPSGSYADSDLSSVKNGSFTMKIVAQNTDGTPSASPN